MINLFMRLYLDVADEMAAIDEASILSEAISELCLVKIFKVKKYWKIAEYFEVSIDLEAISGMSEVSEIIERLGCGWRGKQTDCLWEASPENTFISDKVKWAHIELIE